MKTPEDVNRATSLLAQLKHTRDELAQVRGHLPAFNLRIGFPSAPLAFEIRVHHGERVPDGIAASVSAIKALAIAYLEQKIERIICDLKGLGVDPDAKPAA